LSQKNKSAWQQWKENLGDTRPWDLVNPNALKVPDEIAIQRFNICKACPELSKLTHQCKKCGCFMAAKTKLAEAECPLKKWGKHE
jgi:hypothetical protein